MAHAFPSKLWPSFWTTYQKCLTYQNSGPLVQLSNCSTRSSPPIKTLAFAHALLIKLLPSPWTTYQTSLHIKTLSIWPTYHCSPPVHLSKLWLAFTFNKTWPSGPPIKISPCSNPPIKTLALCQAYLSKLWPTYQNCSLSSIPPIKTVILFRPTSI